MSEMLCCYGKCPACGSFLDVLQDNKDGTYIPKTLTEHQQDRLLKPSMPTRNGRPVSLCSVCYKEKQHNHCLERVASAIRSKRLLNE